jgi:hypothetical protein
MKGKIEITVSDLHRSVFCEGAWSIDVSIVLQDKTIPLFV